MIPLMHSSALVESIGSTLQSSVRLLLVLSLVLGVTLLYQRISRLAGLWLGNDHY